MKKTSVLILLVLLSGVLFSTEPHQFLNPYLATPSLIDFSKISMSHSASFTAGFSSDDTGFYQSKYTNHILYKFNPKLELAVDLNFLNFGTTTQAGFKIEGNEDNQSNIYPEFSLRYQPSENTSIIIEYKRYSPWEYYQNNRRW